MLTLPAALFRPSFALLSVFLVAAAAAPGYKVVDRIPGPDGGYDYLAVDSVRQRLFIGRSYGVMAVDLPTRKVVNTLVEANDVAAVVLIPDSDLALATAYGANEAVLFDRSKGTLHARVPTGERPDAALYDPSSGLVFVMNAGSDDVTLIDPRRAQSVATLPLGGKPESGVADGRGHVYINLEETAEIAAIDVASRRVVRRMKLAGCVEPTGIAYDKTTDTLLSACHNGIARLVEAGTGKDRGSVPVGRNADGAIFDLQRRQAFIPCKDGTLSVLALDAQGRASKLQVLATQPGARTATFDASTGRLYLAAGRLDADDNVVSGTFNVLVVATAKAE